MHSRVSSSSSLPSSRLSIQARGKRLRLLRKMTGLTLHEFAAKYQFSASTLKNWECAVNQGLSSKGASKLVIALQSSGINCSAIWLLHGLGLPPQFFDFQKPNQQMFASEILLGLEGEVYQSEHAIEQEMAFFCQLIDNAITLTIFDDGMEPLYMRGDSVGGQRFYGDELSKAINKHCVIETVDRQLLCRKVASGAELNRFNLYCINPVTLANPPNLYNIEICSAAPITRIWRR